MSVLKDLFTSNTNANIILDESLKVINSAGLQTFKNDKKFFDIFNKIASQVFKHECEKLSTFPPKIALKRLNDIVIKELIHHVLQTYSKEIPKEIPKQPQPEPVVKIEAKEETFKMVLEGEVTTLNSPVTNVKSVKIHEIVMHNKDFIINETNNRLVILQTDTHDGTEFKTECDITLEPGDYNSDQLFSEIEKQLKRESGKDYDLYKNEVNDKVFITCLKLGVSKRTPFKELMDLFIGKSCNITFSIDKEKSTVLNVLGFTDEQDLQGENKYVSKNPLKLLKRNLLKLCISFFNDEELVFQVKEPLSLKRDINTYPIEYSKNFYNDKLPSFNKVVLDFDGYNHRDFPFYILTEVTQMSI